MMLMWFVPVLLVLAVLGSADTVRSPRGWVMVALGLLLLPVIGWATMMGGFGMGMHGYWGWNWSGLVLAFVVIAGLAVAAYFVLKRSGNQESEAEQILRLRLAKGEISPEEYNRLHETLRH